MTKLITLESLKDLDYTKVGLKCGLEIHQQLNTGKLFCTCPCDVIPNDTLTKSVSRVLRFSRSESGDVDKAALAEFKKGKSNVYKYNDRIACLVDLDEEPPGPVNQKALNMVTRVSQMMNLTFFDKLQFMRKLIIDGSVTSGFQRTAILGMGGALKTSFGEVSIEGINLEEDSCRTLERSDDHTIFALDRQGIPLIEITTGPQIHEPDQAFEVAKQIGNILRSFEETRRGLGTIRQDLNVSIPQGTRIEIKGTQNLKLIPEIVKAEVRRQMIHHSIIEELQERKTFGDNFTDNVVYDVSEVFKKTDSEVVFNNLKGKNTGVFAIKLFNFKDILGHELHEGYRFASEVSERNKKHFPQIKGLFHGDELPNYGITEEEVKGIQEHLKLGKEDNFILIVSEKDIATESLNNVMFIIQELLTEVPTEVRQVDPKGTLTKFLRPMPGSARMYPETDVKEIEFTQEYLDEMKKHLPELYNERLNRLSKEFKLEDTKIESFLSTFTEEEVKGLLKASGKSATALYSIVFDIPKDIKKRDGVEPINLKYELLESILKESQENDFNQQTIRDIFLSLYKDNLDSVANLKAYLNEKGLIAEQVDENEIEEKIKEVVEANKGAPFGAVMGQAMKALGGKVDGKKVSEVLKKFM